MKTRKRPQPRIFVSVLLLTFGVLASLPLAAETETTVNLQIFNSVYRGNGTTWYYGGTGLADLRFSSSGNRNMKAQVALEFFPQDSSDPWTSSASVVSLKRLWIKANFPSWRLTAGKTKVAWGNGFVFNAGDILFGSLSPNLDFTQSAVRDDTAFLTAVNIPLGRFSYIEAVLLPPNLDANFQFRSIDHISGGMRFFARIDGLKLEGGYLYKGDAKVDNDILGHRPYLSFHGHAGVDLYGALSLAAGKDSGSGDGYRDTWTEISRTVNLSLGAFHQVQAGYDGTLSFRFEALIMPWQNWEPQIYQEILDGTAGYYGLMLYPEINWSFAGAWNVSLQSIISPVDGSAQLTTGVSWNVIQGLTLMSYVVANIGEENDIFAWDRSGAWLKYPINQPDIGGDLTPDTGFNGIGVTIGARYTY